MIVTFFLKKPFYFIAMLISKFTNRKFVLQQEQSWGLTAKSFLVLGQMIRICKPMQGQNIIDRRIIKSSADSSDFMEIYSVKTSEETVGGWMFK